MPNRTILLIDFDSASIDRATSSLQNAGYRVEVARDGVEGLEAFQRVKPDLVLIEAMIPKKHGFEVCQEIKKTEVGRCIPVLITTAESKGSRFVSDAIKIYGCDDFFEKPIEEEELLAACRRFLGEEDVGEESAGLESLTEDEIVKSLDVLLDESLEASSGPLERLPVSEGHDEPPTQREIEEEDLLSFCDRVFSGEGVQRRHEPESRLDDDTPAPDTEDDTSRAVPVAPPSNLSAVDEIKAELDDLFSDAPIRPDPRTVPNPVEAAPATAESTTARSLLAEELELPSTSGAPVMASRPDDERRSSGLPWMLGAVALLLVAGAAVTAILTLSGGEPSNTHTAAASKATRSGLPQPVVPRSNPTVSSELVGEPGLALDPFGALPVASLAAFDANATRDPATRPAVHDSPPLSEPEAAGSEASVPPLVAQDRGDHDSRDSTAIHATDVAAAGVTAAVLPPTTEVDPSGVTDSRPGTQPDKDVFEDPLTQPPPPPTQLSAETAMAPEQPQLHRAKIRRGALIDIDDVDSLPTPITQPNPEYPAVSRRMRHEGRVVLSLLIDENGRVIDVDVISGVPRTRLDQAATEAVRRWTYRPALKDGVAVKVWKTAEFVFRL